MQSVALPTEKIDQIFVPSKQRVRLLSVNAYCRSSNASTNAMNDGDSYEHDFNYASFIGSLCREFMHDSSGGGSEALVDGVPDLAA